MTKEERENEIFNIQRLIKELTNREDVFLDEYELFMTLTSQNYRPFQMES